MLRASESNRARSEGPAPQRGLLHPLRRLVTAIKGGLAEDEDAQGAERPSPMDPQQCWDENAASPFSPRSLATSSRTLAACALPACTNVPSAETTEAVSSGGLARVAPRRRFSNLTDVDPNPLRASANANQRARSDRLRAQNSGTMESPGSTRPAALPPLLRHLSSTGGVDDQPRLQDAMSAPQPISLGSAQVGDGFTITCSGPSITGPSALRLPAVAHSSRLAADCLSPVTASSPMPTPYPRLAKLLGGKHPAADDDSGGWDGVVLDSPLPGAFRAGPSAAPSPMPPRRTGAGEAAPLLSPVTRPCSSRRPSNVSVSALTASEPTTTLLATSPGTPVNMLRANWSLSDYDIRRRVYKGQMSAVYKATCKRTGLTVGLKIIFLERVQANMVHMLAREVEILASLQHKHIICLYGAFQDSKHLVLVQEYAGHGDLHSVQKALRGPLSEPHVTRLVLVPFLSALAYLHDRGIAHRDIKPENILFTKDWRLVIADFGVAIDLRRERAVTHTGTVEYMAPEVERCPVKHEPMDNKERDDLVYNTAVDVWSTGVLAFELLVGFPPFVSDKPGMRGSASAYLAAHGSVSVPRHLSDGAREFILAALSLDPAARPTAAQLLRNPWVRTGAGALGGAQATPPAQAPPS